MGAGPLEAAPRGARPAEPLPAVWDAVVVGAGPAGSALAILLAREGLRVALLDKAAAPPPKVCGEYLGPGCRRILERIGAGEKLTAGEARARPAGSRARCR